MPISQFAEVIEQLRINIRTACSFRLGTLSVQMHKSDDIRRVPDRKTCVKIDPRQAAVPLRDDGQTQRAFAEVNVDDEYEVSLSHILALSRPMIPAADASEIECMLNACITELILMSDNM
jgi:hypothetical protein